MMNATEMPRAKKADLVGTGPLVVRPPRREAQFQSCRQSTPNQRVRALLPRNAEDFSN